MTKAGNSAKRLLLAKLRFSALVVVWTLVVAAFTFGPATTLFAEKALEKVRIGVLAKNGFERCLKQWGPTADYLKAKVQGYAFSIVPLGFDGISPAIEHGDVNFILVNPAQYVQAVHDNGAERIATMVNLRLGQGYSVYAGSIITRADRKDIEHIADLKGKTFMAPYSGSFAGWHTVWRKIKENGLDPHRDFADLRFGGSHDAVVNAVLDGKVDAGSVRTGVLELMASKGKIRLNDFRAIDMHHPANPHETKEIPFLHSTRHYPEWPFAKVRDTSNELAAKVAIALLSMPPDSPAARAARYAGWTIPSDYMPVKECLQAIRVKPFEDYGNVTIGQSLRQHWLSVISILGFALGSVVFGVYAVQSRRRVLASTKALEKNKERLQSIVEDQTEMICRYLPDCTITFANQAYCRYFDLSCDDIIGQSFMPRIPDEDRLQVKEHFASLGRENPVATHEHRCIMPDGELRWHQWTNRIILNDKGKVIEFQGTGRDITKRRQAEDQRDKTDAQLRHAQKMEAVGQLAGGVAHDFNNLLQVIQGYTDLALNDMDADSPAHAEMEEVMKAAKRAAALVNQLLAFSRRQVLEMDDLDLNKVITDITRMLRRVIGEHITLEAISGHDLGTVRADRGQVEQILINLCVNARDAMPMGGKITIETENVRIDEKFCESHPWAKPGRYVLLSVTDTGCGINEETLARIFEPFYTTKGVGKGTGLGLATVYGLVNQHGGMVHVYSEIDKGTTFKIYLILAERAATAVGHKIKGPVQGGTETILLAEDDTCVRNLTKIILEKTGYTVLAAVDGEEALRMFKNHADEIDLALLDVIMPKLGGRAVFNHILEQRPDIRVLFSSGYSINAVHTDFVLDQGLQLIQKPYQRDDLLRKIRDVLNAAA